VTTQVATAREVTFYDEEYGDCEVFPAGTEVCVEERGELLRIRIPGTSWVQKVTADSLDFLASPVDSSQGGCHG